MLPFLKRKEEVGMSGPIEKVERKPDDDAGDDLDYLEGCMSELSEALKSGDHKAAAEAFRAACQIVDTEPHEEEGPHVDA